MPRTWSKTVEHLSNMLVYPMINHQTSHILIVYTSHLGGKTTASWPRAVDLLVSHSRSVSWGADFVVRWSSIHNNGMAVRSGEASSRVMNPNLLATPIKIELCFQDGIDDTSPNFPNFSLFYIFLEVVSCQSS